MCAHKNTFVYNKLGKYSMHKLFKFFSETDNKISICVYFLIPYFIN